MAQQIWTRQNGQVRGPYSANQIREMVAKSQLPSSAEISTNRKKFHPLSVLKGVPLPSIDEQQPDVAPTIPPVPVALPPLPTQASANPVPQPQIAAPLPPIPVAEVVETNHIAAKPPAPQFDVFISYRRKGGAEIARLVADTLERSGYRVFLDIDGLSSGSWSDAIERHIRECPDFIPILSEGFFDRCQDPNDVVRRELELALNNNKNIIPLFLTNPPFPQSLPATIAQLTAHNGVAYSHEFSKECIAKLQGRLTSSQFGLDRLDTNEAQPKWVVIVIGIVIALLVGATSYYGFSSSDDGFFVRLLAVLIQFPVSFLTRALYLIIGLFAPAFGALFGAASLYKLDANKLYCGPEWVIFWLLYSLVVMFIASLAGMVSTLLLSFILTSTSSSKYAIISGMGSVSSILAVGLFLKYFFKNKWWKVIKKILPA